MKIKHILIPTVAIPFFCMMGMCCSDMGNKKNNTSKINGNMSTLDAKESVYGTMPDGQKIKSFALKNSNGMEVKIIEYGAIVSELKVPDKNNNFADVVLGYDNIEGYLNDSYYFGGTIGRVANRIGGASITVEGKRYELAKNTFPDFGPNHLHGGNKGFDKVVWNGEPFKNENSVGVKLHYLSKDGEEGYPGNVDCLVIYTLNNENELNIEFKATTDKTTLVNFTHHSYFNLSGHGNGTILDHEVFINANKYTVADEDLIPTGEISDVAGKAVDFKSIRTIGSKMDDMQMKKFKGYDLNYIINHVNKEKPELAARALDKISGRILEVYTTQLCMHFYTSNFLEGKTGKAGKAYDKYGAFCFEPQGYPNAPNNPHFESVKLKPEEEYHQTIIYKFSTQK